MESWDPGLAPQKEKLLNPAITPLHFCYCPALWARETLVGARSDHLAAAQAVDEPNKIPNRLIICLYLSRIIAVIGS